MSFFLFRRNFPNGYESQLPIDRGNEPEISNKGVWTIAGFTAMVALLGVAVTECLPTQDTFTFTRNQLEQDARGCQVDSTKYVDVSPLPDGADYTPEQMDMWLAKIVSDYNSCSASAVLANFAILNMDKVLPDNTFAPGWYNFPTTVQTIAPSVG